MAVWGTTRDPCGHIPAVQRLVRTTRTLRLEAEGLLVRVQPGEPEGPRPRRSRSGVLSVRWPLPVPFPMPACPASLGVLTQELPSCSVSGGEPGHGLATVYLIFNRLGRALVQLLPERPEPHGLLALMLLHDARRDARTRDGELVLLADQDRSLWDAAQLTAGPRLSAARPGTRRPWAVRAAAGHRRSAHQADHPSGVPSRSGPWTLSATRGRHGRWLIDEHGHGDVSKDKGTSCNRSRSQQPTS